MNFPRSAGHWRSWLYTIPFSVAVTMAMISIAIVAPGGAFQVWWYRRWASAVLGIFGVRTRLAGLEKLDANANYVIASNHMSLVDTPLLFRYLPGDFKFLAKRELLNVPFIGWYLRRGGHLTVSRGSIRSSIESMNEAARLIRERRLSVLIFPEGTRSLEGVQPFKDGAAYLAIAAGVPVVPVALVGTNKILAAKSSYFRPGEVEIRVGDPIATSTMTLKDRAALTRELEERVKALYGRG